MVAFRATEGATAIVRRIGQVFAFAGIVILLPLTMIGVWAAREVYDVDQYVESVAPLANDQSVRQAVADRLVAEIEKELSGIDWPTFVGATTQDPDIAAELAEVETTVESYLTEQIVQILESTEFQTLWVEVNREAHPLIEQILSGEDTDTVQSSGGVVRINLYPFYEEIEAALRAEGIDLDQGLALTPDDFWFTVFEGDRLVQVQQGLALLDRGIAVAALLVLVLAVALVVLSRRRVLGVALVGGAVALGMVLQSVLLGTAEAYLADAAASRTERQAARVVVETVTDALWIWSGIVFAAGLMTLAAGLLLNFGAKRSADSRITS